MYLDSQEMAAPILPGQVVFVGIICGKDFCVWNLNPFLQVTNLGSKATCNTWMCLRWFVTGSTMANYHFAPRFGSIFRELFRKHSLEQIQEYEFVSSCPVLYTSKLSGNVISNGASNARQLLYKQSCIFIVLVIVLWYSDDINMCCCCCCCLTFPLAFSTITFHPRSPASEPKGHDFWEYAGLGSYARWNCVNPMMDSMMSCVNTWILRVGSFDIPGFVLVGWFVYGKITILHHHLGYKFAWNLFQASNMHI